MRTEIGKNEGEWWSSPYDPGEGALGISGASAARENLRWPRQRLVAYGLTLILIQVFAGHVIFGHLASANFSSLSFARALDP